MAKITKKTLNHVDKAIEKMKITEGYIAKVQKFLDEAQKEVREAHKTEAEHWEFNAKARVTAYHKVLRMLKGEE